MTTTPQSASLRQGRLNPDTALPDCGEDLIRRIQANYKAALEAIGPICTHEGRRAAEALVMKQNAEWRAMTKKLQRLRAKEYGLKA